MISKAEQLGASSAFGQARQAHSERRRAFANATGQDLNTAATGTLRVPVVQLAHNPGNPRASLKAVAEMAESILARDILQPLTVVTRAAFLAVNESAQDQEAIGEAAYVVIDGNRRLAGAKQAGVDDVPVHVDDTLAESAETILEAALIAAVQHEDLEPIDEARALLKLVEKHGSQRAVCRAIGKSSGFVSQRLALLNLTPELQEAVGAGSLPVEVGRKVGKLPEQDQPAAVQEELAKRDRKAKEEVRKRPPAGPGAYAVSTPETPTAGEQGTAEGPKPAPLGAYGVSTQQTPAPADAPVPVPAAREAAAPTPAATAPAGSKPVVKMPWHDGDGVADIVLARMTADQRDILVKRLLAAAGTTASQ